ncbi:tripartite tricarboxylate transporter substrate-binding protein [Pseudooctadecabacter sp.]|uniref:tripartite tricarboxylate transporter substrate-binding protein n=1 Tax=Pseudooctadecabacter sp. TaxID=1966338 RepID=UPI0025F832F5|nr:tripartite tricarboxylate transporter substrate-binding protein [Pseudooctadecabacter sp.]
MLFVAADSPYQSMEDVVAAVEDAPDELIYGSSGPGAITHLTMVSAFAGLGIIDDMKPLPFQGVGPAIKELTAGNIQFFGGTGLLMDRGDFRPLTVFNDTRVENSPTCPSLPWSASRPP